VETRLSRFALSLCAIAVMLAGCGGSQPPISASSAVPQNPTMADLVPRYESSAVYFAGGAAGRYAAAPPLLFVTSYTEDDVTVYHARAKAPVPIATITAGLHAPSGDCLDSKGTLYVANQPPSDLGWIAEYPSGRTKPSLRITDGINTPAFCAIDGSGNLWVTNIGGPNVTEYLHGAKKPHLHISKDIVYPVGIAIDHSGNLYVANRPVSGSANIEVYAPGSKTPSRTITDGVTYPVGIGIDSKGTLYVTNTNVNNVEEYRVGQDEPYQAITKGLDGPVALVLSSARWLYVANDGNSQNVVEFPPDSILPSHRQISQGIVAPGGVAYNPAWLP
jgi:hypothetical protein